MHIATHLPFIITIREDKIILTFHFAKANFLWENLSNIKSFIIFRQPHAYISSRHYEKELTFVRKNHLSAKFSYNTNQQNKVDDYFFLAEIKSYKHLICNT